MLEVWSVRSEGVRSVKGVRSVERERSEGCEECGA